MSTLEQQLNELKEELARSKQEFRDILDHAGTAIWSVNVTTGETRISSGFEKMFGFTQKELDRNPKLWQSLIHPDDRGRVQSYMDKLAEGEPIAYVHRVMLPSGMIRSVKCQGTPVLNERNQVIRLNGLWLDITEEIIVEEHKKEAEKALRESAAKYRLIAENIYDEERIIGTSGFDYVHPEDVAEVHKAFKQIVQTKANKLLQFRFMHAEGYSIYVDCMGTPVLNEQGVVESIVVVSRDITEKVGMVRELQKSEERYRRLIELTPQPMLSHRNGIFMYMNPAAVKLLGARSAEEAIGQSVLNIVHPDYRETAITRWKSIAEKKYAGSMEYKLNCWNGKVVEVEITSIFDEQTQTTLLALNDITDRKKMERELKESEERYRKLAELSPVGISIYKDNLFTYINPAGMQVIGASSKEQVIGTSPLDRVHVDDQERVARIMGNVLSKGYSDPEECRLIRSDGSEIDIVATTTVDPESSSVQLMFTDITEQKRSRQALLESEELNRRLVELSPEPIMLHCDYHFTYLNPAAMKLFGISNPEEIVGSSLLQFIHPDYKQKAILRLADTYELKQATSIVEQKVVLGNGTVLDVELIAAPISYKGKNAGITLMRNISDRKRMEAERSLTELVIRESEDRYFRLQTSLDRFSHELFGVMKKDDIERRLIQEVQEITKAQKVSIVEIGRQHDLFIRSGSPVPSEYKTKILELFSSNLPFSEIIETPDFYFIKFGENRGKSYLLLIGEKPPMMLLTAKVVWLKTITRYVTVLYDNFRHIEDLTEELEQMTAGQVTPPWLLRLLFNLSENERKNLSQDLHDAALQEQIIWYRKLEQISSDSSVSENLREQLFQITQGLLDVIYQIRITCNELRPPMLKEEGIVTSLEALFEMTQLRTDYSIEFVSSGFRHTLDDDLLIGLYRIVQELLANAAKHSNAALVKIILTSYSDHFLLNYEDNGVGMDFTGRQNYYDSMGIHGMKERVRSMEGKIEFFSSRGNGLSIFITVPSQLIEPQ